MGVIHKTLSILRLAKVFFDAAFDKNCKTVSTSNTALLGLKLREKFNAAGFYPGLLGRGQFIFFGDTNHTDVSLHKFFYSPGNVERMAAAGIRHVFPEIEPKYQSLVDDVASGRTTVHQHVMALTALSAEQAGMTLNEFMARKTVREWLENTWLRAEGFRLMKEKGMQIHCLDDRKNIPEQDIKNLFKFMGEIKSFIADRTGLPAILHGKILTRFMIENMKKINKADFSKMGEIIGTRITDDPALAERMKQAAGGERSAVLFGAGHAMKRNGLFDSLGRDRTVLVDLFSNRDLYADRLFQNQERQIPRDFAYILSEDAIYKFRGFKDLRLS